MARIFDPVDGVDFVITASNPDVAFDADGPLPSVFGGVEAGATNNGRLTFPANLHGNPAISIPAGTLDGLPIGLQVVGRHFTEELLLDLALSVERARPWPSGRARLATVTAVQAGDHPARPSAAPAGHRAGARRHDGRVRDHRGAHRAADDHRSSCTATRSTAWRWRATRWPTWSRWSSPAS